MPERIFAWLLLVGIGTILINLIVLGLNLKFYVELHSAEQRMQEFVNQRMQGK